jgi:uncharacterized phage protein (TIGR01671 family)
MKILKFRVWHKIEKRFVELIVIKIEKEQIGYVDKSGAYDIASFKDIVFQQFIGVYARDKREIYEGDIVRYKYLLHEHEVDCTEGEVFFEDGIFFFDRSMEWATNDTCFLEDSLEIVGNIFTGKEKNDS